MLKFLFRFFSFFRILYVPLRQICVFPKVKEVKKIDFKIIVIVDGKKNAIK